MKLLYWKARNSTETKTSKYAAFLDRKRVSSPVAGFECGPLHPRAYHHQRDITAWACKRGRAALFEDCGLMKTGQEVMWADQVVRHAKGPVLMLAPLLVAEQTKKEARELWDVDITLCASQSDVRPGINITNYEKLHKFTPDFSGIVLDESSILKALDGKTKKLVIEFSRNIPYRLAGTATPSPNDYTELGNHAEFLGIMSMSEMLATFFVHDGGETSKWRLKGHAEDKFWEWLSTWSVCMRKPSDLGYSDDGFILPELRIIPHILDCGASEGFLFPVEARTLQERRGARRSSITDKVSAIAEMVNADSDQWIVWCGLNAESSALAAAIHGAVEITGKAAVADGSEQKRRDAMDGFISGKYRVLVTKGRIAGWGLNLQFAHKMAHCSLSDSWEEFYQELCREYRFGQTFAVESHPFLSELEMGVWRNLERKRKDSERMAAALVEHMKDFNQREIKGVRRESVEYKPTVAMELPEWLHA